MSHIDAEADVRRGLAELEQAVEENSDEAHMDGDWGLSLAGGLFADQAEAAPEKASQRESELISMELAAQKRVGLGMAPAKAVQLDEYLQVTGTVQPVNGRVSQVRSAARGRVLEVLAKVGDGCAPAGAGAHR